MDLPLSGEDVSGSCGHSTAAAVAEGGLGGDPESIDVPDEVEDILGALETARICRRQPYTSFSALYFPSHLLERSTISYSCDIRCTFKWVGKQGIGRDVMA